MVSSPTLRSTVLAGACLVVLTVTGAAPAQAATNRQVHLSAPLGAAGAGSGAVSYDPEAAPVGARLAVDVVGGGGRTRVALDVRGLLPDHDYVAHAHVNPCGADAADAGAHFQNTVDPAAGPNRPSTDPAYANAKNEVWMDLHTDGNGAGQAETDVPFSFETRSPRSVVVHENATTATDPGHAGMAGARVACITLPAS